MKYLFFVSFIGLIMLTGCQSLKPPRLSPVSTASSALSFSSDAINLLPSPFASPIFEKGLFKATMDIREHHLTGLAFIKKMPDLSPDSVGSGVKYQLIFSNEFGMTYFDVETSIQHFQVNYCFAPLDKKILWKILETDFRLLFEAGEESVPGDWFVQDSTNYLACKKKQGTIIRWNVYNPTKNTLVEVRGKSSIADLAWITYTWYQNEFPSRVKLVNPIIKLEFSLSLISFN